MSLERLHWYTEKEEKLNIYTHVFGLILFIAGAVLLLFKSQSYPFTGAAALMIYGLSQILIFASSAFYHYQKDPKKRYVANIVDHSMIYVSIAGTYTPFCLISLKGSGGWSLFAVIWIIAIAGMMLKLRFTGKFNLLSTVLYVLMGWIAVFYFREFLENVPLNGIYWVVAGGIIYTLGAVLYVLDKIPYNHAVFHVFILFAGICHFIAVYFYT